MILDLIMIGLLGYQIWMPAVDNGRYQFQIAPDGTIVRMNTQDGTMERCDANFQCSRVAQPATPLQKEPTKELDYKY